MSVTTAIMLILLGGILGMVGQGIRTIIGLKKLHDEAVKLQKKFTELFTPSALWTGLFIGFVAGVLAMFGSAGFDAEVIDKNTMMTVMAAGYAGTDFIEGFIKKYLK